MTPVLFLKSGKNMEYNNILNYITKTIKIGPNADTDCLQSGTYVFRTHFLSLAEFPDFFRNYEMTCTDCF
ncbi:MAG: hypothetical protein K2O70_09385, partial [Desulfovibrionaceae bacterium]|nr:hypothetical protein [Desulfovibrionaceae bacterium]